MKRDMICPTCGEYGFAIRDVAVSVIGKLKCYHCGEWSLFPEWKTVGQLRRSLSAAEKERDTALRERDEAREEITKRRDDEPRRFLEWRGIDEEYGGALVCKDCQGSGIKGYGSTATWCGGIGGQQITSDVCDKCWGSGNLNSKGVDLKRFAADLKGCKSILTSIKTALGCPDLPVEELAGRVGEVGAAAALAQRLYDYYQGPEACGDFTCSCGSCGTCEFRAEAEQILALPIHPKEGETT